MWDNFRYQFVWWIFLIHKRKRKNSVYHFNSVLAPLFLIDITLFSLKIEENHFHPLCSSSRQLLFCCSISVQVCTIALWQWTEMASKFFLPPFFLLLVFLLLGKTNFVHTKHVNAIKHIVVRDNTQTVVLSFCFLSIRFIILLLFQCWSRERRILLILFVGCRC